MKEIKEFRNILNGLYEISANTNFPSTMRTEIHYICSLIKSESKESEWKELDISGLSECPDILTGDYEFEYKINENKDWEKSTISINHRYDIFENILDDKWTYRYRKTPSVPKTNEELAFEYYNNEDHDLCYGGAMIRIQKAFIAGRESNA